MVPLPGFLKSIVEVALAVLFALDGGDVPDYYKYL
jgi:hypothetical protein